MKYIIFLFIFLSCLIVYGQGTISGVITDNQTGEQLMGVSVRLINTDIGCSSNKYGFFSVKPINKKNIISFSYIGYETKLIDIDISNDTVFTIQLLESSIVLNETTIKAADNTFKNAVTGKISIPIRRLKAIPTILGESDMGVFSKLCQA